jgi:hypothetical protein
VELSGRIKRGRNRPSNIKVVEEEFGEPILDTINGLRAAGCNWETVAGAMDITVLTLFRWRKMFGMEIDQGKRVRRKPDTVENLW